MARYKDLDFEYITAATYSLGMLISGYRYELENPEHYMTMVEALDNF